jgi:anaerobic selenocysteine-containing dehydrogenase
MARNKVIEPLGNYKSIFEFFLELAEKMGYGKDFWNGRIEECQNDLLSPFKMTVEELRKFPTGKLYDMVPGEKKYENYEKVFIEKVPD